MSGIICFYNGEFLEKEKVSISLDDLGFSRGYALFEHCRTYGKKVFHLEEHFIRLFESAKALDIPLPCTFEKLSSLIDELISLNHFEELGVKIYLTPGRASTGLYSMTEPTFILYPYPLPTYTPYNFANPIDVSTTYFQRAFAKHKTTFYLPGMLAKKESSASEILFLDPQGHLLESTIASLCAFRGTTLVIPKGDLLKSVTQEVHAKLASSYTSVVREKISIKDIKTFDELFLASSTKEFLPLRSVDGFVIDPSLEFRQTQRLREHFERYIASGLWQPLEGFASKESGTLFHAKA